MLMKNVHSADEYLPLQQASPPLCVNHCDAAIGSITTAQPCSVPQAPTRHLTAGCGCARLLLSNQTKGGVLMQRDNRTSIFSGTVLPRMSAPAR